MSALPVLDAKPKIRPSKSSKWRAGVLVAVHLAIAAHVTHWLVAGRTVTPVEPSEAMAFAKGGIVNAGLVFFAATILLTAVFGRFFCGWACHLVALQDLSRALLARFGRRPKPLRSRLLKWVPAVAFAYMFLWPVAYRLWIGDSFRRVGTEFHTTEFWATFPGWIVGGLTFLTCGLVAVYFLGAKGFCTYACPYGAIYGLAEKVSPLRIRVTDACQGCAHCTAVCTSNVRVHEEVRDFSMVVDSGCMKCLDCVSVCPNDALYYGAGPLPVTARRGADTRPTRRYPLTHGEEAVLGVAFVAGFFAFRGLYGEVPFLMALGVGGIFAYLALLAFRLARRDHVALKGHQLKRAGRLSGAGRGVAALLALTALFWGHSAYVRYHHARGEAAYARTGAWRAAAADVAVPAPLLKSAERATVRRAIRHFETADELGLFGTVALPARLAWLHLLDGSPAASRAAAERSLASGDRVAEMHHALAVGAWRQGDLAGATRRYRAALAAAPSAPTLYLSLGTLLARSGDLAAAEKVFRDGTAALPDSSGMAYGLGLVRALAGDAEEAIAHFGRAVALDPEHLHARENLAGVLASVGRFEESEEHYRRALRQAPDDDATHLLLARVLVALGRHEEALEEAREAVRLAPGNRDAILFADQLAARHAN